MTKEFVQYLKDAIIIKGRINIPGLGTFRGEYQSAQVGENNKLLPPALHLQFIEKANKEDENVINYLVYEASLPKELASQMVRHFIQEVKGSLASNRSAVIGDMGKLHFDAKQKLVFSPNAKSNFYAIASGMDSNIVSTMGKKSRNKRKAAKAKKSKKEKSTKVPFQGESNPKVKKMWPVWLIVILLIISVPIVTVFVKGENNEPGIGKVISEKALAFWSDVKSFSDNLSKSGLISQADSITEAENNLLSSENNIDNSLNYENEASQDSSSINISESVEIAENNTPVEEEQKTPETNAIENTKPIDKHYALTGISDAKLSEIKMTSNTKLFLIAGSFRNKANAKRLKEELIGMGYQSLIIPADGGLNRVALGQFSTVDEALRIFERFHQKKPDIGVWLLVRK